MRRMPVAAESSIDIEITVSLAPERLNFIGIRRFESETIDSQIPCIAGSSRIIEKTNAGRSKRPGSSSAAYESPTSHHQNSKTMFGTRNRNYALVIVRPDVIDALSIKYDELERIQSIIPSVESRAVDLQAKLAEMLDSRVDQDTVESAEPRQPMCARKVKILSRPENPLVSRDCRLDHSFREREPDLGLRSHPRCSFQCWLRDFRFDGSERAQAKRNRSWSGTKTNDELVDVPGCSLGCLGCHRLYHG